jgi:sulfate adenylyltransferase subunit 2
LIGKIANSGILSKHRAIIATSSVVDSGSVQLDHIDQLESESIEIMREVASTTSKPVMLYSIGKDSSVMLRLAQKAFYPGPLPFPLMHIDTGWKFPEMIDFRDQMMRDIGFELIVYTNPRGQTEGIGPISHGSAVHTNVMKTEALRQALDLHGFDVALAGARRDEEKSRAKERIFSFRAPGHRWDPKAQRPELWTLYNTRTNAGETIRVFPLSDWTEADIWTYIVREKIPVVPLYYAADRQVVQRNGQWIMLADNRLPLEPGERPQLRRVRFRTLGCYPLTAAVDSNADTLEAIIAEVVGARHSERQGRVIDHDGAGSMEQKKQEGYF